MASLPITKIGVVTRDRQLVVRAGNESREISGGFEHFRN
jgi:hypothetical protein